MILDTLAAYTGGMDPRHAFRQRRLSTTRTAPSPLPTTSRQFPAIDPAYEVIYLLDALDEAVTGPTGLRSALDAFCESGGGDSLVVVGGEGLWRVHVHVDDPGRAIEAGIQAGRPYDIKITYFLGGGSHDDAASPTTPGLAEQGRTRGQEQPSTHAPAVRPTRAVIAVAYGPGLAALFEEAGAQVLQASGDRPPSAADLERAIDETRADEVVLLANDADTSEVAAAVAERFGAEWAQGDGRARRPAGSRPVRVAAVPAKVTVQGIAALAVHEPTRRFDADVVAMTAAAGATRYGALEVAAVEAWTMAGMCRAGQILGHVENDVALIEDDQFAAASAVLGRMLSAGGEMVTLVVGRGADDGLSEAVAGWLHERHPVVDVVAYEGGQAEYPLLIGVE
jgi:dihydroxyacetone kinase-like predicted kinase